MNRILVTGAAGQIGTELVQALRKTYGKDNVIAVGHKTKPSKEFIDSGPFEYLNILDRDQLQKLVRGKDVDTIYHMASILSAIGELNPQSCYEVNVGGTLNVLEVARTLELERVMTASSIAVFGSGVPRDKVPNDAILQPATMYGITKVAVELLGTYYSKKYGVDYRCVRLPGIISSEAMPGGGTTDYAVEMFYAAVEERRYKCFVRADTILPMMYMPDAIKSLTNLAEAESTQLKRRVYNVQSMNFSAQSLADSIKEIIPTFTCDYVPDYRQEIADSWPRALDDSAARREWDWSPTFNLRQMTEDMISRLRHRLGR